MKKTGAGFKRHRSAQDIATPPEFIEAVERRFGAIACDLAASEHNKVCAAFLSEDVNSLAFAWSELIGNLWLNPPFGSIAPWAAKCAERKNDPRWTLMLVPAASDSNWFHEHVEQNAYVLDLGDRITFVGSKQPYPKGLVLCCFGFGVVGRSYWHWDLRKKKAFERKINAAQAAE